MRPESDEAGEQPLFASSNPAGVPVVFIVRGDVCVVKVGDEVIHASADAKPPAMNAALKVFAQAVKSSHHPIARIHSAR